MAENLNLISTYLFRDKEYVLSLKLISSHTLDVKVTDKFSGEVWAGSYDCTYIENMTHKTGNFKQFDVFLSMLRSGFLKTSDSITLDLLTYEDLEALRCLRKGTSSFYSNAHTSSNKRYLIVTYSVEFDRIHYPLPLDYCGPPNPLLLQATIRKLESEVARLKEMLDKRNQEKFSESSQSMIIRELESRITKLNSENDLLTQEVESLKRKLSKHQLANPSHTEMKRTIRIIEEQVERERQSFHQQVKVLQAKNKQLLCQLEDSQKSEAFLQEQLRQLRPRSDVKGNSPNVNKRIRIRRNKHQLPPVPDRRETHLMKFSARGQMMGDGVNIRSDRCQPRINPGSGVIPRLRNQSESSIASVRSSSLDSNQSNKSRKCRRKPGSSLERTMEKKKEGTSVEKKMGRKNSSLSSKGSDKSNKTKLRRKSNSTCHSSTESYNSDYSTTNDMRRKKKKKKSIRIKNMIPPKGVSTHSRPAVNRDLFKLPRHRFTSSIDGRSTMFGHTLTPLAHRHTALYQPAHTV
ncbi:hypothetical protein M8J77_024849 [Diaphorina citri]|nr:hypothetical protein M8J77_024849 [Diaphorina citri]